MKSAPTDRHRDIAKRRWDGQSVATIASEFETSVQGVCRAIKRVEDYDRGVALLQDDPGSIEGLTLVGLLPSLAQYTLRENGVTRLTDLEYMSSDTLLNLPHITKTAVHQLLGLLDEYRANGSPKPNSSVAPTPSTRSNTF